MSPSRVVKAVDILADSRFGFKPGHETGTLDKLGFDGFEHGFNH
jgi:hypothetical protein